MGQHDHQTLDLNGFPLFYQFYPYFLSCRTRPNPLSSSGEKLSTVGHPSAIYWKSH